MKLGMVIINYKDCKRAIQLASGCSDFSQIGKIVIVDNCSPDDSMERLSTLQTEKVDCIGSDKNGGFSYGCNVGARYLLDQYNPEYILFANTDTIFKEENISSCIAALEKHTNVGMVTTRMRGIDGREQISAWPFTTYKDQLLNCFWGYRHYLASHPKEGYSYRNESFEYVDVARGSFMLFKTKALIEAELFDEHTFLYAEETIMAKRLLKAGYRVGIITDKWYIHNHIENNAKGTSVGQLKALFNSSYYYLSEYDNINFLQKCVFSVAKSYGVAEWIIICKIKESKMRGKQ